MDAGRVEPVGRFVEDQQLRVGEQAAGDSEPLAHSERVALDALVGAVREACPGEGAVDSAVRLGPTRRGDDLEVLATGEEAVEAGLLDDRADARERLCSSRGHGSSEYVHLSG